MRQQVSCGSFGQGYFDPDRITYGSACCCAEGNIPMEVVVPYCTDVVIVAVIAIALLYIGGLLKLLRSVAMVVRYKLDRKDFMHP